MPAAQKKTIDSTNATAIGKHLVSDHGWPAGLLEVGCYTAVELQPEHRSLQWQHGDRQVAGGRRPDRNGPLVGPVHTHDPLPCGSYLGS